MPLDVCTGFPIPVSLQNCFCRLFSPHHLKALRRNRTISDFGFSRKSYLSKKKKKKKRQNTHPFEKHHHQAATDYFRPLYLLLSTSCGSSPHPILLPSFHSHHPFSPRRTPISPSPFLPTSLFTQPSTLPPSSSSSLSTQFAYQSSWIGSSRQRKLKENMKKGETEKASGSYTALQRKTLHSPAI